MERKYRVLNLRNMKSYSQSAPSDLGKSINLFSALVSINKTKGDSLYFKKVIFRIKSTNSCELNSVVKRPM